jgi:hypothetical protein
MTRRFVFGLRRDAIEDPSSSASIGGGVFNLVRRSVLASSGGFEALKMEVLDDVALGQRIKAAGGRCSVANGHGLVGLHFYRSIGAFLDGAKKNAYAFVGRFVLWRALLVVATSCALELSPLAALTYGGTAALVGGCLLLLDVAGALMFARWMHRPLLSGLLVPFGAMLLTFSTLQSIVLATATGGIYWRETFYPLAELRAGRRYRPLGAARQGQKA